jgi:hypothetical protein
LTSQSAPAARWLARLCALVTVAAVGALAVAAPAHAAVPDRFGFVLWNGAAVVPSGTFPAANTVVMLVPGRYRVIFSGQGAKGGVVHVTSINPAPHWCQVDAFWQAGADELAQIACYKAGGALDASAFSAIYDSSSGPPAVPGGQFGYVDWAGAIVSQYNSAGGVNVVAHLGIGQWHVRMPGLATPGPIDGSLQATAINDSPVRCKVGKWGSGAAGQDIIVLCFNPAGALADTRFTLTYQYQRSLYGGLAPPKRFGYLWNAPPLGPPSTNFNFPLGPGVNTLTPAGLGLSLVRFPQLAVLPDDIQVTASGGNSNFCGLNTIWAHAGPDTIVRDVNCFDNAGVPVDTGFLISDNSAF